MGNSILHIHELNYLIKPDKNFLHNHGVYVLIFNQDIPPIEEHLLIKWLDEAEIRRMGKYHTQVLKKRFLVRHGVLRYLLASIAERHPASVEFTYGHYGKPFLPYHPIAFNVSHSQQLAMLAISAYPVGVDIEFMKQSDDLGAITKTHFALDEQVAWQSLANEQRLQGFYNAWARKEAFIKMDGRGLQLPLDSFSVSLHPNHHAEIMRSEQVDCSEYRLWDIPAPNGYASALVSTIHVNQINLYYLNTDNS